MKVIIAGSRTMIPTPENWYQLNLFYKRISEVVSGGCLGADAFGERWAQSLGLPIKKFVPEWDVYGKAAGPIRNKKMVDYADGLIVFAGGKGTQDIHDQALRADINIWDLANSSSWTMEV